MQRVDARQVCCIYYPDRLKAPKPHICVDCSRERMSPDGLLSQAIDFSYAILNSALEFKILVRLVLVSLIIELKKKIDLVQNL